MGLFGTILSILNHKSLKATRNLFILQTMFSLSVIVTKIPLGKLLYSLEFYGGTSTFYQHITVIIVRLSNSFCQNMTHLT